MMRELSEDPPRPKVVKLWCCRCKEQPTAKGPNANEEGNLDIDDPAEWTYGYVGHFILCQ